ncbi:MAG TPA: pitrilysin family protein [Gemmatimonadaceae bacterium]|nr:pitrilysin family protein [Gemmatimonadaceae bacterium]
MTGCCNRRAVTLAVGALAAPLALSAQTSAFPEPPPSTPAATLVVPRVRSASLGNGIQLRIVEQPELPLAQVTLVVAGGSRLDGDAPGLASFMAGMLDEGAGARDALALQSEIAYLGASLSAFADWDRVVVSLKAPVRTLPAALDLMADVVMRPTFRATEVRRQRDLRLTSLLQRRDQPNALADLAFNQVVFPAAHPYHRCALGDSASVARFDSVGVRSFYDRLLRPDRATIYVVGDVDEPQARRLVQERFGAWRGAAVAMPAPPLLPPVPAREVSRVFLVDKPQAAQSVIIIGWPGVERTTPDYAAITVMNTVLGGSFSSRLNTNLRETKGYTYGASSGFSWRVAPGPFSASASVRTDVTDSSLVEFFRELRAIRDTLVPAVEVARAKAYVELRLPGSLESTTQVANQLAQLAMFGLTLEELPRFAAQVRAVTSADVQRVARRYLAPDQAAIVVVGDLGRIRPGIEALRLGEITVLEVGQIAR